jgi:hypothetical protein
LALNAIRVGMRHGHAFTYAGGNPLFTAQQLGQEFFMVGDRLVGLEYLGQLPHGI